MKSELGLRPIYRQVEKRVEAHIFVAFLAYALSVTLRQRLAPCAPGLTPRAVLEKLATLQILDACLPTTDRRWLIMPRSTQPEPEQQVAGSNPSRRTRIRDLRTALPGKSVRRHQESHLAG